MTIRSSTEIAAHASIALALSLALSLAAALPLRAQDFAGGQGDVVGGDGISTTNDDEITSTTPDLLLLVSAALPAATPHTCHVFASADNLFGGNGTYIFGVRDGGFIDDPPVVASERRIEFTDDPDVNDESWKPVATNFTFSGLTGTHSFHFTARKNAAANADMTINSSSMSVICVLETL